MALSGCNKTELCAPLSSWMSTLSCQLSGQRQSGLLCDVVILPDDSRDTTLAAHSCVLAANSPLLSSSLLSHGLLVSGHGLSSATWTHLLDFLYTGKVKFTVNQNVLTYLI